MPPTAPVPHETQASPADAVSQLSSLPRRYRHGQSYPMAPGPQFQGNQPPLHLPTPHSWWSHGFGQMKKAPPTYHPRIHSAQAVWSSHPSDDQLRPDDSATHRLTLGFTGKHDSPLQVSLWTHLVYLFECEPQIISALGFSLRLRKLLLKRSEWMYAAITLQGIQPLRQVHSLCIGQDEENEDFKNIGVSEIKS